MIGLFWMGHHSVFRYITVLDRPVIAINLVFLGTIAFLPYPTSLLGGNGPDRVPTIFYAVCISCAGLAELAVWLYASQVKDLLVPGTSPAVRRYIALRVARIPVVFLLSIPIAVVSAQLATYFWILVAVLGTALDRFARPADEHEDEGESPIRRADGPAG